MALSFATGSWCNNVKIVTTISLGVTHCHRSRFVQGEDSTVDPTIIRIVEVSQHLTVLRSRIYLQQFTSKRKAWPSFLNEAEEVAKGQSFVQV